MRQVRDFERDATAKMREEQEAVRSSMKEKGIPSELFPESAPFKLFPWAEALGPRSDCEEVLRRAIALRDEALLMRELQGRALEVGLDKNNSRVYFEAAELRDLLRAEGVNTKRSQASSYHEARVSRSSSARSAHSDGAAEGVASSADAPSEVMGRLSAALDAFVEGVDTTVSTETPLPLPYVDVLESRCAEWTHLLHEKDLAEKAKIMAMVSDVVGVTDLETEAEKEKENEKEVEVEKDKEILIEKFVDRAYLREGEEPTSWAFCTLAERREAGGEDEAKLPPPSATAVGAALAGDLRTLAPFRDGSIYRASQYRLTQRSPMPFPDYLCVSRNHHNLDWVGERRLKNAVMLLEWVPSVAALRALPSRASTLSEAQERRLRNALALLDLGGKGRLSRLELREVCAARLEIV